jgi:hypothetical protein
MNKQDILKIAGVKDEKSLYKLFPDEQSFMAKHGKTIKKALMGDSIQKAPFGKKIPYGYNPDYMSPDVYPYEGENVFNPNILSGTLNQPANLKQGFNPSNYQIGQFSNMPKQLGYSLSGNPTGQQFDLSGSPISGLSSQQSLISQGAASNSGGGGNMLGQLGGMTDIPGKLVGGITKLIAEKQQRKHAEQWRDVSGIQLQASQTEDIDANRQLTDNMTKRRQMMMPVNTGEEFFPIYGTGTNPLAKDGKKIKGKKAMSGAMTSMIGQNLNKVTGALYGDNAGVDLGGTLGSTAGQLVGGPLGGMIGEQIGKFAGWALDSNPRKIEKANDETFRNANMMAFNNMQHSNQYMRAGGHLKDYTSPSEEAMQTFAMGGDLQTYGGGYAQPVSNNPYSESPTVKFIGDSHDNGGIDMTYSNKPVEVEGGEFGKEINAKDGKSFIVYGNMKPNKEYLELAGLSEFKGKKFKGIADILSKKEKAQSNIIDKSTKQLEDFNPITPFDRLKMNSITANMKGADMNFASIEKKKTDTANLQQAMLEESEERGIDPEDFAKGKFKQAKKGISIPKAEYGMEPYKGYVSTREVSPGWTNDIHRANDLWNMIDAIKSQSLNNSQKQDIVNKLNAQHSKSLPPIDRQKNNSYVPYTLPEENIDFNSFESTPVDNKLDMRDFQSAPVQNKYYTESSDQSISKEQQIPWWMQTANSLIPNLIPPYDIQRPNFGPEGLAASLNQETPVPMQTFQPSLTSPYKVSLQQQRNNNNAIFRAAQRMMPYNSAVQANLAAQLYDANAGVSEKEFILNQERENQTYAQNRQALDNAQLHNLQAYDQQSARQSQAKSNTKAEKIAIAKSVADKMAKYEEEKYISRMEQSRNNFRVDAQGRPVNWNGLAQFDTSGNNARTNMNRSVSGIPEDWMTLYDEHGNFQGAKKRTNIKKVLNGTIVKALKNI